MALLLSDMMVFRNCRNAAKVLLFLPGLSGQMLVVFVMPLWDMLPSSRFTAAYTLPIMQRCIMVPMSCSNWLVQLFTPHSIKPYVYVLRQRAAGGLANDSLSHHLHQVLLHNYLQAHRQPTVIGFRDIWGEGSGWSGRHLCRAQY